MACLSCILASAFALFFGQPATEYTYPAPIDALSVHLQNKTSQAQVSSFDGHAWSEWQELAVEDEQDPALLESNLVVFPKGVFAIRLRGDTAGGLLHPLRVSGAPSSVEVASTMTISSPRILTRAQWGADDSLLYRSTPVSSSSAPKPASSSSAPAVPADQGIGDDSTSQREKDCLSWQQNSPEDFSISPNVVHVENGKTLRWAHTYSTQIKLLTVHHTAQSLKDEHRSGAEMVRAIYQYHAQSRGWGDIGYHYLIDSSGQIYEGKAGGDFVVGGHAYCSNVGTIGIALIGNFDEAAPAQAQAKSLQWLLKSLADRYKVNLDGAVQYHGFRLPAVVGHRQLVQTDCPGAFLFEALPDIRAHAAAGLVDAAVDFPGPQPTSSEKILPTDSTTANRTVKRIGQGFSAVGSTAIEGRPGGQVIIPILYRAGTSGLKSGQMIGSIARTSRSLSVWQEKDGQYTAVRQSVVTPVALAPGASVMLRLRVQLPLDRGSSVMHVGDLAFTLTAAGKRLRASQVTTSYAGDYPSGATALIPSVSAEETSSASSSSSPVSRTTDGLTGQSRIRILLHDTADFSTVTLRTEGGDARVNATGFPGQKLVLSMDGTLCQAAEDGRTKKAAILRVIPSGGQTTLTSWKKSTNRFRGVIECRVIDGKMALINELTLDEYLQGLGEEPDSEPLEKQKAFAIAARTYAAWYMEDDHRKFPGKPYDGSDSPADFQKYSGVVFEQQNPRWQQATEATAGQLLRYQGQLIKPPYFSSDDGRTRNPSEAGWNDFPFPQIFQSKDDHWCNGMTLQGHGVGMSGCGAEAQANEGKTAEQILQYYYPGTTTR